MFLSEGFNGWGTSGQAFPIVGAMGKREVSGISGIIFYAGKRGGTHSLRKKVQTPMLHG